MSLKMFKSNKICSIPQCRNRAGETFSLHRFPPDEMLRKKWAIAIGIEKKLPKTACVCSAHFTDSDFFYNDVCTQRRRLRKVAIPSCNIPKRVLEMERRSPDKENAHTRCEWAVKRQQLKEINEMNVTATMECEHTPSVSEGLKEEDDESWRGRESLNNEGSSSKMTHPNEKSNKSSVESDVIAVDEIKKKMLNNEDIQIPDSNQNVDKSSFAKHVNLKTRTSSDLECVKDKSIDKEDQSSSSAISISLNTESGSSSALTFSKAEGLCRTKCGVPIPKADVKSKDYDVIVDVTMLMKSNPVSKSANDILFFNSDPLSKSTSSFIKNHNLNDKTAANKLYNKKLCVPPKEVIPQNIAGDASSNENGTKICCISNVFTIAESSADEMLAAKNVNDKNRCVIDNITTLDDITTDSLDDTTTDSERNFWPREDPLSYDDDNMNDDEIEVEDIKLEEDDDSLGSCRENPQNSLDLIPQKLIFPGIPSETSISSNPVGISTSSPSHRKEGVSSSKKTRDSQDDTKTQPSLLSKQKRKKLPRWTSEVEVIRKSDGIISLWPVSF